MAKYLVTSGSAFRPFTYDELVKPIQQMAEAHNSAQDAYDQIGAEAESLRRYLDQEPEDSVARKMYNSYMDKLSTLQNNLWSNGYNAQTRRDLSAARAGYASDITRLGSAIKTRQERSAAYWKTKHDNPDMVMGVDPGSGSLDDYLKNDSFGQNYFAYSGNQFAKEVGSEIKARASEWLSDPRIERDPELKGWLTRIQTSGATNAEVNAAYAAVVGLIGNDPTNLSRITPEMLAPLDTKTRILAGTLISNLQATGVAGQVDANEFGRLMQYGLRGLSEGVGKTETKDFEDKEYEFQQKLRLMDEQQKRELATYQAKKSIDAATKAATDKSTARIENTHTDTLTGPRYTKVRDRLARDLDEDKSTLLISKSGRAVHSAVEASSLVYSEDLRRDAYSKLGFDIGRDPKAVVSDNFLRGHIKHNGVDYEMYYNPHVTYNGQKGAVMAKTADGQAYISPEHTNYYRQVRQQYLDTLNSYKQNDKDIYKLASIDPDKQHDLYEREGVDDIVPLSQFKEAAMMSPQNSVRDVVYTTVARAGTDSGGYTDRIGAIIAQNMRKSDDKLKKERRVLRKDATGNTDYIHELTDYGTVAKNAVKHPDSIFNLEKGKITNIDSVELDIDAVEGNYFICGTSKTNKKYAVNISMLNDDALEHEYEECRELFREIDQSSLSYEEKQYMKNRAVQNLSVKYKDLFGYLENAQSQGGSSQENKN